MNGSHWRIGGTRSSALPAMCSCGTSCSTSCDMSARIATLSCTHTTKRLVAGWN